jgi:multicomponent Na+:H+ antiporter subunit G
MTLPLTTAAETTSTLPTWHAAIVTVFLTIGAFFLVVGTVGLLRLPDVYNRMHATSKATTIGASSILFAAAIYFFPDGAALTTLVGILFLFLTAPTGAHVISRAAKKMGVEFYGRTEWPEPDGDDGNGD